jgi:small subunit ribosomal protein S20
MPNTQSAKKRMRQALARRTRNRIQRTTVRTAIKNVRTASTPEEARPALRLAERLIDRAARKGLMAKGTAARHKRRLSKLVAAR